MEKINLTSTVFRARITPAEVRAKIAEDAAKAAAKIGEKVIEPKKPKREKPENSVNTGEETEAKKAKPKETKKKKEPPALEFPVSVRINAYGFIGLKKGLLKALDWKKDLTLKLERNPDGSVTVRKA